MKNKTKHIFIALLCLISLLVFSLSLAACQVRKDTTYTVTISNYDTTQGSVTLSPEAEDGKYEKDTEITVTVTPNEGYALDTFTLSTDANATPDSEGKFVFKVTADTTITVTFKSTVVPVESVTFDEDTLQLEVGGRTEDASATLVVNVHPDNATDKTVTWTSSNPAVATVEGGNVTALTVGETTITATAGGKSATCTVTVTQHTHTIDTEKGLQNDETSHWHVCKTCGEKMDEATHSLKINEAKTAFKCEQCEYEVAHTHDTELRNTGDDGHKTVCKTEGCGYESAVTAHAAAEGAQWKQDTENNQHYKECVCGAHVEVASHTAKDDEWLKNEDNTKHYQLCICGEKVNEAEHTAKEGAEWKQDEENNQHYKECVCGEHVEVASHTAKDDEWHQDAEKGEHYKECVCGEHVEVAAHYNEDDEYVSDGATGHHQVCTACKASFNQSSHNLSEEYKGSEAGHYQICLDNCGYQTDPVEHTNPNPDGKYTWYKDEKQGTTHGFDCPVCEFAVRIIHSNSYKYDYTQKDGEYKYCEQCDMRDFVGSHVLGSPTSNDNGTHTVKCSHVACTYKEELPCSMNWTKLQDEAIGHKGVCSECSYTIESEPHDTLGVGGACSKCGYLAGHTCVDNADANGYYDGVCDTCGKIVDNTWTFANGTISAYNGNYAKLKIPTEIESTAVTTFSGNFLHNTTITDVLIPEGIEVSELTFATNGLFCGCKNLRTVIILAKITTIEMLTFNDCTSLDWIVLPETLKTISDMAFWGGSEEATLNKIYFLGTKEQWDLVKPDDFSVVETLDEMDIVKDAEVFYFKAEGGTSSAKEWHWEVEGVTPKEWE